MSTTEKDHAENQIGVLVMLFVLFSYAANIVNDKIQSMLYKVGKDYTRESKMDYNRSKGLSKTLSEIYERLIGDAIPALVLSGENQSSMAKFDEMQKGANNYIELAANVFSAMQADESALVKINSYAKTLAKGKEVLDSEIIDSFRK